MCVYVGGCVGKTASHLWLGTPSLCSGWHHATYAHLVQALWFFPCGRSLVFIISRAAALKIHTFAWETADRGQLRTVSAHTRTTICKTWADGAICLLAHAMASVFVCACGCVGGGDFLQVSWVKQNWICATGSPSTSISYLVLSLLHKCSLRGGGEEKISTG